MLLAFAALIWLVGLGVSLARRRVSEAWRDVLALGLLGIATVGFFWRLLAGQVWMPAGGGDLAQFLFPTYAFAANTWRQGILPLWNPYLFAGAPFVGDIQSGIFYPLNLLTFLIASPLTFRDMEFLSVLHFYIAGAGMYAFLRWGYWRGARENLARVAALAGALAFEFSDLFITHFGNLNLIAVAAWLPLILLCYRRAVTDRRAGFAALAGAVLAISFYAGHPQLFLFNVIALVLFALYETSISAQPAVMARAYPVGLLVMVALVSGGLVAPVLLPSIEMAQNTVRATYTYEQAARFSLPPAELIGMVVPGFFGRGVANTWGPWDRVEVGYLGVLPLVLALLALALRRDAPTRGLGALALIGLGLALGGYAIVHGWLYQLVPGFGQLRAPARFIVLMDFALAALAAFGFDTLLKTLPRERAIVFKRIVRATPWVFLLIAFPTGALAYSNLILGQGQDAALFMRIANATNALIFFILLFALSSALILARATRYFHRSLWAMLALALIFFDLFSLGAYVDASTDDPSRVYDHPDAVAFFKNVGGLFRIDPRETGVESTWPPDTAILYGLDDVNGDNPLVLADYDRYWQSLGSRSARLYDLLNTRFLIARKSAPVDRDKFKLAFDDVAFNVYENTRVLPRALMVFGARAVADHTAAFAAIHAADFDPAQTVILENADPASALASALASAMPSDPSATANIVGYGVNEIWVDTNATSAGVLVLSEVWYPGWRAWVDDREVAVVRADYLFRGVQLPAGAHHVKLIYDPASFKIGVGLFALTVLVLAMLGLRIKIRRVEQ